MKSVPVGHWMVEREGKAMVNTVMTGVLCKMCTNHAFINNINDCYMYVYIFVCVIYYRLTWQMSTQVFLYFFYTFIFIWIFFCEPRNPLQEQIGSQVFVQSYGICRFCKHLKKCYHRNSFTKAFIILALMHENSHFWFMICHKYDTIVIMEVHY